MSTQKTTTGAAPLIRRPVRNQNAATYILLMVISLGVTVVGTRFYLELTNYPQLGNDIFHIAHALWGGLLQAVAAILMLVFADRWSFRIAAILAGMGMGLFVDEIGKFITQQVDYFFPLAAPIIYIVFVTTIYLYLSVRNIRLRDARSQMYNVLEDIQDILDNQLSEEEHQELSQQLQQLSTQQQRPDIAKLALSLLDFVNSKEIHIHAPTRWDALLNWLSIWEQRHLTHSQLYRFITTMLFLLSAVATIWIVIAIMLLFNPRELTLFTAALISIGHITGPTSLVSYFMMAVLNIITGAMLILAWAMLVRGRQLSGVRTATGSLVISLTLTNIFTIYFDQFSIIMSALLQLLLLLALHRYRQRFLEVQYPHSEKHHLSQGQANDTVVGVQ